MGKNSQSNASNYTIQIMRVSRRTVLNHCLWSLIRTYSSRSRSCSSCRSGQSSWCIRTCRSQSYTSSMRYAEYFYLILSVTLRLSSELDQAVRIFGRNSLKNIWTWAKDLSISVTVSGRCESALIRDINSSHLGWYYIWQFHLIGIVLYKNTHELLQRW